ncbi:uncharacterized protein [Lolium perenne]|uniref:uncharacterized protein isoform X4 n=1 Tax=Lolium perenne TaxID=4522 RepID=UPI003A9A1B5A
MFAKNHCGEDRVRLGLECFRCVLPTCVQETRFERFGGREDFFIGLGSAGRGNQFDYVRSRVQDHGDFSGQTRTYGSPRFLCRLASMPGKMISMHNAYLVKYSGLARQLWKWRQAGFFCDCLWTAGWVDISWRSCQSVALLISSPHDVPSVFLLSFRFPSCWFKLSLLISVCFLLFLH